MKAIPIAFNLELKHPFTISGFSRTSTPLLLLKLSDGEVDGYGEASMVPYLGENQETAGAFLKQVDWSRFRFPFNFPEIIHYLDGIAAGNTAIKAAIDMALNDLNGNLLQQPCYEIYAADPAKMPLAAYTIGMTDPSLIGERLAAATDFKLIKVKLGGENDREVIQALRKVTSLPLLVDANQGWTDRKKTIELIYWLHDQGVLLVEQPMNKLDKEGNAWLTGRSPIPIIADEAVQRLADLEQVKGAYHGINVKLMKCGGMYEAHQMILKAKSYGMKVMMGCMSETSIATQAGIALAPLCNWADLDGPYLTSNNPLTNPRLENGRYIAEDLPGLGLKGLPDDLFAV